VTSECLYASKAASVNRYIDRQTVKLNDPPTDRPTDRPTSQRPIPSGCVQKIRFDRSVGFGFLYDVNSRNNRPTFTSQFSIYVLIQKDSICNKAADLFFKQTLSYDRRVMKHEFIKHVERSVFVAVK
jgi:hypothetical protein